MTDKGTSMQVESESKGRTQWEGRRRQDRNPLYTIATTSKETGRTGVSGTEDDAAIKERGRQTQEVTLHGDHKAPRGPPHGIHKRTYMEGGSTWRC